MNKKRQSERLSVYSGIAAEYGIKNINELRDKPLDRKFYDLFAEKVMNKGCVLEIGCGPGEISNYLWMRGIEITGIDVSEEMIKSAENYNSDIDFQVGDVFSLKFADSSIAGIVAPYLIVNFDLNEVEEAFLEMKRVLCADGILLASFHIGENENKTIPDFFGKRKPLTFTFFRMDTIKDMLVKAGFTITEVVIKEPYEGEVTSRAYVFAVKK